MKVSGSKKNKRAKKEKKNKHEEPTKESDRARKRGGRKTRKSSLEFAYKFFYSRYAKWIHQSKSTYSRYQLSICRSYLALAWSFSCPFRSMCFMAFYSSLPSCEKKLLDSVEQQTTSTTKTTTTKKKTPTTTWCFLKLFLTRIYARAAFIVSEL